MKKLIFKTLMLVAMGYLASCNDCNGKECKEPISAMENSKHLIPLSYSEKLYNNFESRFRGPIRNIQMEGRENVADYNPTKYVLLNIETLECYLKFLKEVEKKNDKKITGLALFFGANKMNESTLDKPGFNKIHQEELDAQKMMSCKKRDSLMYANDIRGRITLFIAPTHRTNSEFTGPNGEVRHVSEVQRHVPFFIQPHNKELDPYKGEYTNLFTIYNKVHASNMIQNDFTRDLSFGPSPSSFIPEGDNVTEDGTSLIFEELTDMPPKTPIDDTNSSTQ